MNFRTGRVWNIAKWEVRTRIYYCDPNRSDQKGALEKNHEYIRYVLQKEQALKNDRQDNAAVIKSYQ